MKGAKGAKPAAAAAPGGGEGPADTEAHIDRLFQQLDTHTRNGQHDLVVKNATEILVCAHDDGALAPMSLRKSANRLLRAQDTIPGDEDATHCLAVAELHLRHFDKALAALEVRRGA